jgi:hypothetical protein
MNNLTHSTASNAIKLDTAALEGIKQNARDVIADALNLWEQGSFSQARAEIYYLFSPAISEVMEGIDISELTEEVGEEASDPYAWAGFVNRSLFQKLRQEYSWS